MTDIVYKTVNLPPAFVGVPYEAAVAITGSTIPTTALTGSGNSPGLPAGLAFSSTTGDLRITGTPTGAASTPFGSGTAQSGAGVYTFTVSVSDTAGAVTKSYTINLYAAPNDRAWLQDTASTAAMVTQLGMGG